MPEQSALSPGLQCFSPAPVFRQLHKRSYLSTIINYTTQEFTFTVSSAADGLDTEPTVTAAPESSTNVPEQRAREMLWFRAANVHTASASQHTNTAGRNTKTHTHTHTATVIAPKQSLSHTLVHSLTHSSSSSQCSWAETSSREKKENENKHAGTFDDCVDSL